MGLNFPAAPLVGDVYPTPALPGVPQWTWNGTTWKSGSIDTANYVRKSGDTLTGPLVLAADPAADMQAATRLYVDAYTLGQQDNLLVNGFFDVSQENAFNALNLAAASYPTDQWLAQGMSGFTVQNQSGGYGGGVDRQLAFVSPAGYTASPATTAYWTQYIEGYRFAKAGWGTAAGRPVSLGLWVYSNLGGVMTATMRNSGTRSYCVPLTIPAATWVYRTATFPPCPDGSWPIDTTAGAQLFLSWMAMTGLVAAAANSWQSTNVICAPTQTHMFNAGGQGNYIAGVTLVLGNAPVPQARVPYLRRPYDEELLSCMRYFQWNAYSENGFMLAANQAVFWHKPKVTYRVTPSLALSTTSFYLEGPPWATAINVTGGTINAGHATRPTTIDYQLGGTFSVSPAVYVPMGLFTDNLVKFNARM